MPDAETTVKNAIGDAITEVEQVSSDLELTELDRSMLIDSIYNKIVTEDILKALKKL
jgi:hypothetical protein